MDLPARAHSDHSVGHGCGEDRRRPGVNEFDGRRCQGLVVSLLGRQRLDECLNLTLSDSTNRSIPQARVHMSTQIRFQLSRCQGPVDLRSSPFFRVGLKGDSACGRVYVCSGQL